LVVGGDLPTHSARENSLICYKDEKVRIEEDEALAAQVIAPLISGFEWPADADKHHCAFREAAWTVQVALQLCCVFLAQDGIAVRSTDGG
jgi:hypothetical protein